MYSVVGIVKGSKTNDMIDDDDDNDNNINSFERTIHGHKTKIIDLYAR